MGEAVAVHRRHVLCRGGQQRPLSQQFQAAGRGVVLHRAGEGEHVAALLGGVVRRQQCPGMARRGLHHQRAQGHAADDAVALREVPAVRLGAGRVGGQHRAAAAQLVIQCPIFRRVHHVHAAAQHGHGVPTGTESAPQGAAVDALGHAGHHRKAQGRQVAAHALRHADAVRGGLPGAHYRHGGLVIQLPPLPQAVQHQGRGEDVRQAAGIAGVVEGQDKDMLLTAAGQNTLRRGKRRFL